jgi:hypothetical protein
VVLVGELQPALGFICNINRNIMYNTNDWKVPAPRINIDVL